MQLDNRTPYEVAWLPGRLRYPGHSLTFIVKATYDLVSGGVARVAEEQIGIGGDEDQPGDGLASLYYESDLVHHKPQADRLLVGRCHAPGGKPTVACQVSFSVASWSRSLHVMGNRVWKRQMLKRTPSSPEPFTSMDLCYENAFGGPDYAPNPVGKGFQRAGGASDDRVHNIEDPGQPVKSQSDRPVPAGFAPVSRTWWPRKDYIGTYGKPWFKTRCPWFPEDMDWKVTNAAPIPSLVPGYLEGNEPVKLLNLHKNVPLYETRLPGVRLRCLVERWGKNGAGGYEEPQMRLDTLWIDTENEKLILVWRGDCDVVSDEFEDLKRLHVVAEPMETRAATRDQLIATVLAPPPSREAGADAAATSGSARVENAMASEFDAGPTGAVATDAGATGADSVDDPDLALPPSATTTPVQDLRAVLETIPPSPEATPEQEEARQEILALIAELERPEPEDDPIVAAPMPDIPWSRERVLEAIETKASLESADLAGLDLSNVEFQGCNLARVRLREANLTSAVLDGCDLQGADLERVRADGASFVESGLSRAVLRSAEMRKAILTGARLAEADLSGAQLSGANLEGAVLREANLEGASLEGAHSVDASFAGAKLDGLVATEADFSGASFKGASLNGARLERTNLSGAGFEHAKAHRVDMTGADLAEAEFLSAELTEGDFRWIRGETSQWIGCELTKANFFEADLDGADFSKSTMVGCNFSAVSFRGGILRRANLEKASLVRSDLFEALLPAARLVGTDLRGANLFAADLSDAVMSQLEVAGANIKRTRLES